VSCGALSKRDCEGYVEAARVALDIQSSLGSVRTVADAGCPARPCNPPVDAWVAFIRGDQVIGAAVLRGDPSRPPTVERWAGPLPSLPPR